MTLLATRTTCFAARRPPRRWSFNRPSADSMTNHSRLDVSWQGVPSAPFTSASWGRRTDPAGHPCLRATALIPHVTYSPDPRCRSGGASAYAGVVAVGGRKTPKGSATTTAPALPADQRRFSARLQGDRQGRGSSEVSPGGHSASFRPRNAAGLLCSQGSTVAWRGSGRLLGSQPDRPAPGQLAVRGLHAWWRFCVLRLAAFRPPKT